MTTISFTVLGRGQQRGSKQASLIPKRGGGWAMKNGRPIVVARDMNRKSKDWMQEVRSVASEAMGDREPIKSPIVLTAKFYFGRPASHFGSGKNAKKLKPSAPATHGQSPDLDKLLRSLCDALTGVVIADDRYVASIVASRHWAETAEKTEVMIEEIG